jgi:hypothetical protein
MNPTKVIAWVAVAGIGLYLLYRTTRGTQSEFSDALSIFDPIFGAPNTMPGRNTTLPGNTSGSGPSTAMALGTAAVGTAATIGGAVAGGGGGAAGAAGAAGAGIGAGAAIAITAGAAGAALLAWGIIAKGWFRGGEEALHVNPARDEFIATFVPVHKAIFGVIYPASTYDTSIRDGDWKYLFAEVLAHFDPNYGPQLTSRLLSADTKDELDSAVKAIQSFVAASLQRAA